MDGYAVLTVVGDDRPGLVDEVTRFVLDCGANLEDGRMVNLHGQFAMMMLLDAAAPVFDCLRARLPALTEASRVRAELTPAGAGRPSAAAAIPYRLTASGMDHPGLVQPVAHLLAERGVNIESAQTTLSHAPVTGAPLFEMEFVLSVPADLAVADLRSALSSLCDELNVDWRLATL
ncbi:MAG TPA: ACT domain-containing protein [Thermoleophilia bacterium]|nr:ACT domain-containing protein [Thermoleophilia bacterium]